MDAIHAARLGIAPLQKRLSDFSTTRRPSRDLQRPSMDPPGGAIFDIWRAETTCESRPAAADLQKRGHSVGDGIPMDGRRWRRSAPEIRHRPCWIFNARKMRGLETTAANSHMRVRRNKAAASTAHIPIRRRYRSQEWNLRAYLPPGMNYISPSRPSPGALRDRRKPVYNTRVRAEVTFDGALGFDGDLEFWPKMVNLFWKRIRRGLPAIEVDFAKERAGLHGLAHTKVGGEFRR